MTKAIIFDLDGVIYDSEPIHVKTEKLILAKYGLKISTVELAPYTGSTAKFMFTSLIKKYHLPTTFDKIFKEKNKLFFKELRKNLHLNKGIKNLLEKIKKEKIKLALATSSHKKIWQFVLNKSKLKKYFPVIVSAEDIIKPKPDPEIFLKVAKRLKIKQQECLVVEDSTNGVLAAKKAKMKCVGYQNPNSGGQDLSKADIIIDTFDKFII